MPSSLKKRALAAALMAASLTAATGAEARDGYRSHGDDAAIAVGAGIIGLAIGAAIASDHDRYYRHRRYYRYGYPGGFYESGPRYRVYRGYPRQYYRRDWRRDWRGGWDGGHGDHGGYHGRYDGDDHSGGHSHHWR